MRSDLLNFRGWRLVVLIVLALALTACGGAASTEEESAPTEAEEPAAEEETVATEEEPVAEEEPAEAAEAAEESDAATEEEVAPETDQSETEAEAATEDENLLDPDSSTSQAAECVPVDIPENPLIAEVSEADWSLGPADAPLTVIEYGDFQ